MMKRKESVEPVRTREVPTMRTHDVYKPGLLAFSLVIALVTGARAQNDRLPSWNDGPSKRAIIDFVTRVTTPGSPDFVPANERCATFDNDGTLWAEQPIYFQLQFAFDRVKALAQQHPEWKTKEPFSHLIAGDMKAFMAGGEKAVLTVVAAAHSGVTTEEFEQIVKDWLATVVWRRQEITNPQMNFNLIARKRFMKSQAFLTRNGAPVNPSYDVLFMFTGKLEKVTIDLK